MSEPGGTRTHPGAMAIAFAAAVMAPVLAYVVWMLATSRPSPALVFCAAAYVLGPAVFLWVLWQRWSLRANRRTQLAVVAGAAALLLVLALVLFAVWP